MNLFQIHHGGLYQHNWSNFSISTISLNSKSYSSLLIASDRIFFASSNNKSIFYQHLYPYNYSILISSIRSTSSSAYQFLITFLSSIDILIWMVHIHNQIILDLNIFNIRWEYKSSLSSLPFLAFTPTS